MTIKFGKALVLNYFEKLLIFFKTVMHKFYWMYSVEKKKMGIMSARCQGLIMLVTVKRLNGYCVPGYCQLKEIVW